MAKKALDPRLIEILQKYHPDPRSALWDCHGVWVIYHKAVELIAANAGITFDQPIILEGSAKDKVATILVTGNLGSYSEWSIGEAAPGNNKNSYPWAMAEKRAKDRVVLKLLGLHGEIYSYDEVDEEELAKEEARRTKTAPKEDPAPVAAPTVSEQQTIVPAMLHEIGLIQTVGDLGIWAARHAEQISKLAETQQQKIRDAFKAHKASLSQVAA